MRFISATFLTAALTGCGHIPYGGACDTLYLTEANAYGQAEESEYLDCDGDGAADHLSDAMINPYTMGADGSTFPALLVKATFFAGTAAIEATCDGDWAEVVGVTHDTAEWMGVTNMPLPASGTAACLVRFTNQDGNRIDMSMVDSPFTFGSDLCIVRDAEGSLSEPTLTHNCGELGAAGDDPDPTEPDPGHGGGGGPTDETYGVGDYETVNVTVDIRLDAVYPMTDVAIIVWGEPTSYEDHAVLRNWWGDGGIFGSYGETDRITFDIPVMASGETFVQLQVDLGGNDYLVFNTGVEGQLDWRVDDITVDGLSVDTTLLRNDGKHLEYAGQPDSVIPVDCEKRFDEGTCGGDLWFVVEMP
ncbi:MAG: hypothetical protein O3B64_03435 [bacterium]|nr:hypothetical protein [bacterium]